MTSTPPGEMLSAVLDDLKSRRLTQLDIADKTGYKTRQAISAIFSSGKYMTQQQARRFADAFGYYEGYLTMGIGSLRSPESPEDNDASVIFPKMILALQPYESQEEFQKAFDRLVGSAFALYGEDEVQNFLNTCVRYLSFFTELDDEKIEKIVNNLPKNSPKLRTQTRDDVRQEMQTQRYREEEQRIKRNLQDRLYREYCILFEER